MLTSTKPDSKGKEAVLFRSRLLTEFKWTPKGDIPVYKPKTGKTALLAGKEQCGMLYSSTEPTDKFITENISFETFLSVIANPDSALYHKDLNGHNNSWAYFGIVCNGLVRYALNIRRRYSTKRWQTVPGMYKVADEADFTAEQIALCDVLYAYGKGSNHVALITDILRDDTGEIRKIEVSEAVRPTCKRVQYDVEAFYEKYKLFALWRYTFVDSVPMPDEKDVACLEKGVPDMPSIAVDYGNKTNYRAYEEIVISVFDEGENEIEIHKGNSPIEKIRIPGRGKIVRKLERGYYIVKHVNTGECIEFCVTAPEIRHTVKDGKITVEADSHDPESKLLYMEFREKSRGASDKASAKDHENNEVVFYSDTCAPLAKVEELTDAEKKSGIIQRNIPDDAVNFKVYFENKYGIWTHTMIQI